jgi:hypothetical protein
MEPFDKARQSFQNSKGWKKVMGKDGTANRIGSVTSLEVTYGIGNGWHPHLHMLIFCKAGAFDEREADEQGRLTSKAIDYFRSEWVRLLEKRKLVDGNNRQWANQYALDVRGGKGAAEYIAKWGHEEQWGMSRELTSSHAKTGKRETWGAKNHYTPFQLLAMSNDGDGHATCAFREFVTAFEGKRMLTWSPGLKNYFGVEEMDDTTAAAELELDLATENMVGTITQNQLTRLVSYGAYGKFLAYIAEFGYLSNGQQLIDEWIAECNGQRRSGTLLIDHMQINGNKYWYEAVETIA